MVFTFRLYRILVFFALIVGGYEVCFSQRNNFENYSIEEGLPQSSVYCVFQDSKGYLWIGTDGGGVSRFNGLKFQNFSKKSGLCGTVVRTIIEDSRGNIWIGTQDGGISVYDGVNFNTIDTADGLSSTQILRLFEDSKFNVWAGTAKGGLNKVRYISEDSVLVKSITTDDGLLSDFIFDIQEDQYKRIWLATYRGGINILYNEKGALKMDYLKRGFDIPSNIILCLNKDKKGNILAGTEDEGAFKIILSGSDSGKVVTYSSNGSAVWSINEDNSKNIWMATNDSGIVRIDSNNKSTLFNTLNGLPNNQCLDIEIDREENVWIGTFGSGISKIRGFDFNHYTVDDGLSYNEIYGITQDKNGNFWLACAEGGLSVMNLEGRTPSVTNVTGALNKNYQVKTVAISKDSYVWFGTFNKGIVRFDGKEFVELGEIDGLVGNKVNALKIDMNNNIWAGTTSGISKFDGVGFINLTEKHGFPHNEVQTIIEDSHGFLWFGTLGGLALYKGDGILITYDEMEGLDDKRIHSLAEGPAGNVWIGTFGGGIYKFDVNSEEDKPIHLFANDDVITSNNIYSLVFQNDSQLIVGTDKGLDKITLDKNQNITKIRNIGKDDGFIGVENNLNAVYKDNENHIWFGTIKGLSEFVPELEKTQVIPPSIHLTGMNLFFEKMDWSTYTDSIIPWSQLPFNLELPYNKNHVTFTYTGISMTNPSSVRYKYRLLGLSDEWSPPIIENQVVFAGLHPETYTFEIIASNKSGIWSPEPARFSFTITPPFWKTGWFYTLCGLMLAVIIISYIKYREKALKEEKRILEEKVRQRTAEVVRQKEEIEVKNQTLEQAYVEITLQKEVIEEKNQDIMDSINYAERIQRAMLPQNEDKERLLQNSFILFKPKDVVSGDFFWIGEKDEKVFFTAADCTGHGVPGAFMSMIGSAFLNQGVNEMNFTSPSIVLDHVKSEVIKSLKQGESGDSKDGMDAGLCALDRNKGILEFAGGNNPVYVIRTGNSPLKNVDTSEVVEAKEVLEDVHLYEVKADKMPIAYYTGNEDLFTNHRFTVLPGDRIYLSTDGYPDQFGGPKGKKFKYKNFKILLMELNEVPLKELGDKLNDIIIDWMNEGDSEQIDDICIIGVEV